MKKIVLFVLVAACVCKTTGSFAQVNVGDSLALVSLYDSAGGASWTNTWDLNTPVSGWYGVTVSGGRVTTIEMESNNLVGALSTSLGTLSMLTILDLYTNELSGSIPASLGNLTNLTYLLLGGNELSGSIPATLGNLTKLYALDLSVNLLSDSIPASLGISRLEYLYVYNNQLSGNIPTSFGHGYFYFYNNDYNFSGIEPIAAYRAPYRDTGLEFTPQAAISLHYASGTFSVTAGGTLANDTFHWYNGSQLIAVNVGDSTFSSNVSGRYSVAVTNSVITAATKTYNNLTLYSDTIIIGGDSLIMPAHPRVEYADRQYIDTSGWTYYYWDNNTPNDYTDDTLLLSLNTHGQNIGTIGDGMFAVKLVATAGAGSNSGIELTNPLITNPSGYWVMNRYWLVTATKEPMANVGVRFYYNAQDLADVNGSYPTHNLTNQQLIFYKEIGGNPDPTTDLAGATAIISILPSTYASDTTWTYHQLTDTTSYAEFSVASFSGGGGGGTGNDQTLPIKLLNFTAIKEGSKNLLQWTTEQEVNSSYFEVERSGDGVNYKAIGQVNGTVNSSVAKNYSLVDAKPVNGMNYYRLKMMDKDGEFSYSLVRTINEAVSFVASIYPNPVQNNLNLSFSSDKAMEVQVEVVDNEGKVVATQEMGVAAGVSIQGMNVGGLSSGVYYVRVVGSEGETEERFVKE